MRKPYCKIEIVTQLEGSAMLKFNERPVITAQEAAYQAGKSVTTILREAAKNAMRTAKIQAVLIDAEDFLNWQRQTQPSNQGWKKQNSN